MKSKPIHTPNALGKITLALAMAGCLSWAPTVLAEEKKVDSFTEALVEGDTSLSFRYRIEHVDQESFDKKATASTLKTRLSYNSADYNGFSVKFELDDVRHVLVDDFNSGGGTSPNKSNYPVIPDAEYTDMNQAYLQYKAGDTVTRFGRQRILLNNQRFIGGVAFRQNEQTYDAAMVSTAAGESGTFTYAYINQANRIFPEDVRAGTHDHNSHAVNYQYKLNNTDKLTAYAVLAEVDQAPGLDSDSFGIRYTGSSAMDSGELLYTAEYATQSDAGDNPISYDADYLHGELGLAYDGIKYFVGIEILEGSDTAGKSFRTPLATLHKFNGWADMFLTTPTAGLEDTYIKVAGNAGGYGYVVKFHHFESEVGSDNYGDELDFMVSKKLDKNYSIALKYAHFISAGPLPDTDKIWFTFSANY